MALTNRALIGGAGRKGRELLGGDRGAEDA